MRFAETDAQGVAHNAGYLVWFEVARVDYLARFRGGYPGCGQGIEALTTESHVRYLAPARFDDRLRIHARCGDAPRRALPLRVPVERDGEAIADGWTRHACVDAATLRPTRVPALARGRDRYCGELTPVGAGSGRSARVGPCRCFFFGGSGRGFVPDADDRGSPR